MMMMMMMMESSVECLMPLSHLTEKQGKCSRERERERVCPRSYFVSQRSQPTLGFLCDDIMPGGVEERLSAVQVWWRAAGKKLIFSSCH